MYQLLGAMINKLKHLDLFSGIGGFSLGLEATGGFETMAFCDIEKYPRQVLKKHWPHVKQYEDIKELNYERLKADGLLPIDIITGGYPCQPFSVAGRKKGEEDPRHLWPEYFRLIKELRPTWVIGENVSGHIKLGLDTVLENLESEGYSARTFSISASSVGAKHQRERVWIVAYSECNYNFNKEQRVNGEEKEISREHREDNSTTRQSSRTSTTRTQSDSHVENSRQHGGGIEPTRNSESVGRGTFKETKWSIDTNQISGSSERSKTVANTQSQWSGEIKNIDKEKRNKGGSETQSYSSGGNVANTSAGRCVSQENEIPAGGNSIEHQGWWNSEPDVGRVAHGIPKRVDRLKSLGNSLVPQIPYYIGKVILEVMNAEID